MSLNRSSLFTMNTMYLSAGNIDMNPEMTPETITAQSGILLYNNTHDIVTGNIIITVATIAWNKSLK